MDEDTTARLEPKDATGKRSLTERAYHELEELIATLKLKPGEVLSETGLAEQLGIGRTPVREALQRLAIEGMVVVLPRRGILVSEINVSRQLQLIEVRRELERLVARTAARRASEAERRAFAELADALEAAASTDDDIGFMRLDKEFNAMTVAACRNQVAASAMRQIQGLSRRFWYRHYQEALDLPRCVRLHKGVAEAIAAGDEVVAVAASDSLVDYIEEFARATV